MEFPPTDRKDINKSIGLIVTDNYDYTRADPFRRLWYFLGGFARAYFVVKI